ncbi:MAG: hypothetical protein E7375_03505 [Clostridiales bacterium]|nr:hypothetical protein [Clostridiales bacterium]
MKRFVMQALKTPMFLVFIAIVLIYGIAALGQPAAVNRYAIVTAIGIDKANDGENEIEVSLLTFTPVANVNYTEKYKVVSAKGRAVSEALDYAGLRLGREVGLSHVNILVLNIDLLDEDIGHYLDYFSRNKVLAGTTKVVVTDKSAKDFLSVVEKMDSDSSIKINEVLSYNKEYVYATDSSLESFFKGYFGPTKVSLVPLLSIIKDETGVGVSASGSDDSGQSSSGSGQTEGEIVNNGDTLVFKEGKRVLMLDGLDMKIIQLIKGDFKTGSFVLENYSDDIFTNAELGFEMLENKIHYKVVYENNIPIFMVESELTMELAEIENQGVVVEKNVEFMKFTDQMKNAVILKIKNLMAEGIELMRDNQIDLIDFYTIMHNSDPKAFSKFLSSLENEEDYLSQMVFKINVNIFTR